VAALSGLTGSEDSVHEIVVESERAQTSSAIARVVSQDWKLPPDLLVSFEQEGHSNRVRVPLGADGSARAEDLAPGHYRLFAIAPPALHCEMTDAEIEADAVADLGTLALDPPGRLDLSRLASDASFEVWLEPKEGQSRFCWRGAGGSAEPLELFAGSYTLVRILEGGKALPSPFEMLSRGLVVIDADLKPH
jgi:hypothetical protein